MEDLSKYKLVFNLFKKIIVFDESNNLLLAGDEIKKILSDTNIDIDNIVLNKFSDSEGKKLLASITKVRKNQLYYSYIFNGFKEDFILIPANFNNSKCVILSTKNEIEEIDKIEIALEEKVKELECLYKISHELETFSNIYTALDKCVHHIKQGFRFPEISNVYIKFENKTYGDKNFKEKHYKTQITEYIIRNNKKKGKISVCYNKKKTFLKEEITLLKEITGKISRAIEKNKKADDLEKRKKALLSKNKTLIELTEECQESREKLQAFFTAITDKIIVIDSEFNIIMSNNDEIGESGKCYKKLFNCNKICDNCPALITFNKAQSSVFEKKEKEKIFQLNSFPIYNNEQKVDRVLEVCRDITKEKHMEEQLLQSYKFASLGKLVTGVAHEINNPNTFILGNIKIISEAFNDILPLLDEYYNENKELKIARLDYNTFKDNITILLEDMVNGSVRMKKIVEDLRNFAKNDENEILNEDININNLIKNTVRLIEKQIKKTSEIKLELHKNIPKFIGSISKLEQVIVNIIINASQAIDKENSLIIVKTEYIEKNNLIKIIISDNGKGMDKKTKRNIFDPFFTTKRNSGGTGLGLSISYGIIKEHNGIIEVDSTPKIGTIFTISIPLNKI